MLLPQILISHALLNFSMLQNRIDSRVFIGNNNKLLLHDTGNKLDIYIVLLELSACFGTSRNIISKTTSTSKKIRHDWQISRGSERERAVGAAG